MGLPFFFSIFAQSHRRIEFRFHARTSHCLIHCVGAKVNSPRPFHTAKIRVHGDCLKNARFEQFQKHTAAVFWFNGKNTAHAIIENDLQSVTRKWFRQNNPNHRISLLQWRNFGRLLISAGKRPSLAQLGLMQSRPFENESHRAAAHLTINDFESVNTYLDFFALVSAWKCAGG